MSPWVSTLISTLPCSFWQDDAGYMFFIYACDYGLIDIVRQFLDLGVSLYSNHIRSDILGIFGSAYHESSEVVKILLNNSRVVIHPFFRETILSLLNNKNVRRDIKKLLRPFA